jgi:hypothetical protein
MTTPAEYRELALDCLREAESADSAMMRLTMVGLARIWMDVALELDQSLTPDDDDARKASVRPHEWGQVGAP